MSNSLPYRELRRALLKWYDAHARALPWKENVSPYRVWISEIMLQQTQVGTVLDSYFNRFIERFPDISALAAAEEQDVLQLWEGLGYYSRARNLHKAARVVQEQYRGVFPSDVKIVETLPGVGRYTAGAIVSMAFNLPVPILEANTVRIHARLLGIDAPTQSRAIQNILWQTAQDWVESADRSAFPPGKINQALMQFGQQVCKKRPLCDSCPLAQWCQAKKTGLENVIPLPIPKQKTIFWHHAAVVIYDKQGRIFLRKNQPGEHWAGLWDFARVNCEEEPLEVSSQKLAATINPSLFTSCSPVPALVQSRFGLIVQLDSPEPFLTIHHAVTNHKITLDCYRAKVSKKSECLDLEYVWIKPEQLAQYPLCSTGRKIADSLN